MQSSQSLLVPKSLHTEIFTHLDLFIPFGQIPRRKKMVGPLGCSHDLLGTLARHAITPQANPFPVFLGQRLPVPCRAVPVKGEEKDEEKRILCVFDY